MRLGFLLLLLADPSERDRVKQRYLSFLQAVQVVLSEDGAFDLELAPPGFAGCFFFCEFGKEGRLPDSGHYFFGVNDISTIVEFHFAKQTFNRIEFVL